MRGFTESVNNIVYFPDLKEDELFLEDGEKTKRCRKNPYTKELQRNNAVGKQNKGSKVKSKHKKKNNRKALVRIIEFIAVIIFIFLLSLYASKMNVLGQSDEEATNRYYRELEHNFTASVQKELEEAGLKNAGITISCIIEPGIRHEYNVKIYHGKLKECSSKELDILMDRLKDITFPDSSCGVKYEILL